MSPNSASTVKWLGFCNATVIWSNLYKVPLSQGCTELRTLTIPKGYIFQQQQTKIVFGLLCTMFLFRVPLNVPISIKCSVEVEQLKTPTLFQLLKKFRKQSHNWILSQRSTILFSCQHIPIPQPSYSFAAPIPSRVWLGMSYVSFI